MEYKFFFDYGGEKISAISNIPFQNCEVGVILLHCFCCSKYHRILKNLSSALEDSGISTFRFDFSGNGESSGKIEESNYTKMISQIKGAILEFKKKGVKRIGIAGHSMGAMLSLLSAYEFQDIKSVCFIAGSSDASRVRVVFPKEAIEEAETIGHSVAFVYNRNIPLKKEFLEDIEKYNVGYCAAELKKPIFFIHGTNDETIAYYHSKQLYRWSKEPKKLELIKNADHMFSNSEHLELLKKYVVEWFNFTLSP